MPKKSKALSGKPRGSRSSEAKARRLSRGNFRRESEANSRVVRRQPEEAAVLAVGWKNARLLRREIVIARRVQLHSAGAARKVKLESEEEYVQTIAATSQTSVIVTETSLAGSEETELVPTSPTDIVESVKSESISEAKKHGAAKSVLAADGSNLAGTKCKAASKH